MALALLILFCLRYRSRFSVPLIWLLIAETLLDLGSSTIEGIRGGVIGGASGTTWLIVAFYVPVMQVFPRPYSLATPGKAQRAAYALKSYCTSDYRLRISVGFRGQSAGAGHERAAQALAGIRQPQLVE